MSTEMASYEEMKNDRNLLKKNLFSDNPDHAMIARTTLSGIHNAQLQKKYKLSDDMLAKMRGSDQDKEDSRKEKENKKDKVRDENKTPTENQHSGQQLIQEIAREKVEDTGSNVDEEEVMVEIEDDEERGESEPEISDEKQGKSVRGTARHLGTGGGKGRGLKNAENGDQEKIEIDETEKVVVINEDDDEEIAIQEEENEENKDTTKLKKDVGEELEEVAVELDENQHSESPEDSQNLDEFEDEEDENIKRRKLSWGIPKALRLLTELDSFTGQSENKDQQNLQNFPSYLSTVRKCIMHAGILTMGHPTFQKKIGHLLRQFLQIRATEWESNAYGARSSNDMAYFSELMLNKVNTLDAYEAEVKKLFDEKEHGHDYIKQGAKSVLRSVASTATFGLSELAIRAHQKKAYKNDLAEKKMTKAEEKIRKLESKKEDEIQELDEDIAKLESEYHRTALGEKIRDWKIGRRENKKGELEKKLETQETKINEKESEDGLNAQIKQLQAKAEDSSGIVKLYYRCKKHVKEEKLEEIKIADKIQNAIGTASEIQADGFATAIDEDSSEEEKAAAVADSIDAAKSVHSKMQEKADPRNHEHLAMALHLLVRTIRDDENGNAFYTADYDTRKLKSLLETYETPYYDESSSSSGKDAFDKFELKEDTNSNKLLQRMLAVIMVFDNESLLNNSGIRLIFSGEKPEIFDVANGNKIWEKNSFKLGTENYTGLLSNCARISAGSKDDQCYKSFNEIFAKKVFADTLRNGLSRDESKSILKCFCGTSGDSEAQKIYDLLMQPECSFRNIKERLRDVYAVKNPAQKTS